jgi:hypothetical protein
VALELLKRAKANGGLGDAAVDEDREAAVEAGHTALTHCLPRTIHYTLVFSHLKQTDSRNYCHTFTSPHKIGFLAITFSFKKSVFYTLSVLFEDKTLEPI